MTAIAKPDEVARATDPPPAPPAPIPALSPMVMRPAAYRDAVRALRREARLALAASAARPDFDERTTNVGTLL